ncbi:hypothetical protein VSS74_12260 [Conexibacter stalactiti]|uniref:Uncharacterized protein n=1 Tax=Conexibacter stalactiti TaxID=1940611 RepID=A0ABU4HP75_9ACTN|nr:hypothetical protein [Conexibacter stalactiti]MDW5595116.1 hypothetical protein [Conexibacter stalactiti]MEC5035758.1 hypothetical protein [Conexibacter stalactiti]
MTDATITVPAAEVAAVVSSLQTLYSVRTEAMSSIALDDDPAIVAARLRPPPKHPTTPGTTAAHREELTIIEHVLDQLVCDGELVDDADRPVRVDRAIFEAALLDMLLDAVNDLEQARSEFADMRDLDAMIEQHHRVGELPQCSAPRWTGRPSPA